jgi:hypothetical protein
MPTKDALIDQLQAELEGGVDTSLDSLFGGWVDEIHRRIRTKLDLPDDDVILTLTASDPEISDVALPATIRQVSRVINSDHERLPFVDRRAVADLSYDLSQRGKPRAWAWGNYDEANNVRTIRFVPYPSAADIPAAFTLIGRRDPFDLSGSSQIPLPPDVIPALKMGVRALWRESEELDPSRHWSLFEGWLEDAWRRLANEPQPRGEIDPDADLHLVRRPRGVALRVPEFIEE